MVAANPPPVPIAEESRLVLDGISWATYSRLRRESSSRLKMTYDSGTLEIMSPSYRHESAASLLAEMVKRLSLAHGVHYACGASTTFRRKGIEKGVEPDQCFWIANAARMRGKKSVNLKSDSPPDLVIEVDITRSSLDRLRIFAQFGVPEVWRFDGRRFSTLTLRKNKTYRLANRSLSFPTFPMPVIQEFLDRLDVEVEGLLVDEFEQFVRRHRDSGGRS